MLAYSSWNKNCLRFYPYEEPTDAEIVIDSSGESPEVLVKEIFAKIKLFGYLK